jgi:hypothetical protein
MCACLLELGVCKVWCMEVREVFDTVFSIVWWECKQLYYFYFHLFKR